MFQQFFSHLHILTENPGFSVFFHLGKTVYNRVGTTGLFFFCKPCEKQQRKLYMVGLVGGGGGWWWVVWSG